MKDGGVRRAVIYTTGDNEDPLQKGRAVKNKIGKETSISYWKGTDRSERDQWLILRLIYTLLSTQLTYKTVCIVTIKNREKIMLLKFVLFFVI